MKILILGGTAFLGRHIVSVTVLRGHEVTVFHRGETMCDLPRGVTEIFGDRQNDLRLYLTGTWDAVVDTSGFVPAVVESSAQFFRSKVDRYVFISSISAYSSFSKIGITEDWPLLRSTSDNDNTYGVQKAECERVVRKLFGDRILIVRPGLIVGPFDPTDRFTYWPERVSQGGEILAPGKPDKLIQFIDVRDLADWIIKMVESHEVGTYNAVGPSTAVTMGEFLEICRTVCNNDARFTWVDECFLVSEGVGEWIELPFWLRETEDYLGFLRIDGTRSYTKGLSTRSIYETVSDTLRWSRERGLGGRKAGLERAREQELLTKWHNTVS